MSAWFVGIAGNMGVGKSTLTKRLSELLGWEPFYEAVDDNPYLADFYRDMRAWSFHSQVFFLSRRLQHHYGLCQRSHAVIQDRTVYEDAEIFARNLYLQGMLGARDYGSYRTLYEVMCQILPPPSLIVYLRASVATLQERIALRGRQYERSIDVSYLERLNTLYDDWAARFSLCPVLTVQTDHLDLAHNDSHVARMGAEIMAALGH